MSDDNKPTWRKRVVAAFEYYGELILMGILFVIVIITNQIETVGVAVDLNINYPIVSAIFTVIISATVVLLVEASSRGTLIASAIRNDEYDFLRATFRRPILLSAVGLLLSTLASIFTIEPGSALRLLPIKEILIYLIYFLLLSSIISFINAAKYATTTLFGESETKAEKILEENDK